MAAETQSLRFHEIRSRFLPLLFESLGFWVLRVMGFEALGFWVLRGLGF